MADTTITVDSFKHNTSATRVGTFIKTVRLSIHVGDYGPFTKDFADDQNLTANIATWKAQMQAQVQTVAGGV
jgi:topoisomerase IA-like protein